MLTDKASLLTEDGNEFLKIRLCDYQSKADAKKFLSEMLADKKYKVDIKRHREKRSIEANAKAWVLIHKLAEVLELPPEGIYRRHVREIGIFDQYLMLEGAYEDFSKAWERGHIGRFTKVIGESREKQGYLWIAVYFGSSDFNSKQMYVFIENIMQECKTQGIETLSPNELDALINRWESPHTKERM